MWVAKTLCIEPGFPWEDGYTANLNGKIGDEPLGRPTPCTMKEVKELTDRHRLAYTHMRPHGFLYLPSATSTGNNPAIRIFSGAGDTDIATGASNGNTTC